jgi:hypothetical protein
LNDAQLPKLVLIDGLPGSGKSTTAHALCLHLTRLGHAARWYWELEAPHPVLEFQEPIENDRLRDGFLESALTRWRSFAATVAAGDSTAIVESTFLQSVVQPMFALDLGAETIAAYLRDVEEAILPAAPLVVLLRHDDVGAAFAEVTRIRGEWFPELIESKVRETPYARRRGLHGISGAIEYLTAYQALTEALVAGLRIPHVTIDVPADRSEGIVKLAKVLNLPGFAPFDTNVDDPSAFLGKYRRIDTDDCCCVLTDGRHLYVEGAPNTRLLQREGSRFDLSGTCVEFEFHAGPEGRMDRLECRGNFPNLAPTWVRHE